MRRTLSLLATLLSASLLVFSCSEKLSKQTGLTDQDLFSRGQQMLAKKSYGNAIEHFQVLLERFPTSPLAPRAQLSLADARKENGDHVEAEVAYDDFLRLYPASDNVPYALFQKGELLSAQVGKPNRDQTKTYEAIRTYKILLEKQPSGPVADKAAQRIAKLRNRLAEHEAAVVTHYLARKKYDSAEARAKRAIADYSDTAGLPSLMSLLAEALEKEGKKEEAAEVRKSLREKFPGAGAKRR
ncbi:MAG TPA: outer membrane protein assembly factor BamD [Candidatus Deferrimicrobiaceae bacterium]|nr:outer membrane protein assembly factor BamD [Candidatus Deferrimicrobiaceae bacterium]